MDCIYIDKEKSPVGKGFRINVFTIDYTKSMFCALCVEPCPVDCIFMGFQLRPELFQSYGCIVDYAKLPLEIAWAARPSTRLLCLNPKWFIILSG